MNSTTNRRTGMGWILVLCMAAAVSVPAATVTWIATSGGTWDTNSPNWTGGSPTPNLYVEGDNAVFTGAVNQTILVQSSGVMPGSLLFSNTANTITLAPAAGATGFLNAGAGTFTKNGAGTVVVTQSFVTAASASHGDTTVGAGNLLRWP